MGPTPKESQIDFLATYTQYIDHLAPTWHALPESYRGNFWVPLSLATHAQLRGIRRPATLFDATRSLVERRQRLMENKERLLVTCSYGDTQHAYRSNRSVIYCEHGSGQSFGMTNPANPGGIGRARQNVILYIMPNDYCALRNLEAYPMVPNAVVGCPKLDVWHQQPTKRRSNPPVVCVSFHWDRFTIPEARSAWGWFEHVLRPLARSKEWKVIGHGHPRQMDDYAIKYKAIGIEPVPDFEEVMARADVYVNDCSSTIFEFASTDRPVVVLNAPWYRRDVEFGLRFWEYANVGVQCSEPELLQDAIRQAFADAPAQRAARHQAVAGVYKYTDGRAADRAAQAMMDAVHNRARRGR
jgi:hypothetical protein